MLSWGELESGKVRFRLLIQPDLSPAPNTRKLMGEYRLLQVTSQVIFRLQQFPNGV